MGKKLEPETLEMCEKMHPIKYENRKKKKKNKESKTKEPKPPTVSLEENGTLESSEAKRKRDVEEDPTLELPESNGRGSEKNRKKKKKSNETSSSEEGNGILKVAEKKSDVEKQEKNKSETDLGETKEIGGVIVSGTETKELKYRALNSFAESGLPNEVLECCKDFTRPSPIQSHAWPFLLDGRDFIGIAATGSGDQSFFLLLPLISTLSCSYVQCTHTYSP